MFNEERKFGVEIEFVAKKRAFGLTFSELVHEIETTFRQHGLDCCYEGYNHNTRNHWKLVTDSSVRASITGHHGLEVVSPPLKGFAGILQLKAACAALDDLEATVDITCGLHVHHDASDFTHAEHFKNLALIYKRFEPTIDELVANSRRRDNNGMCKSILSVFNNHAAAMGPSAAEKYFEMLTTHDQVCYFFNNDRYKKLNFKSYQLHGTVEFRHHHGSTNFEKIAYWVMLTQAMVERAVDRPVRPVFRDTSWEAFKDFLGCNHNPNNKTSAYDIGTKAVYKYFNKRRKVLAA